MDVNGVSSIPPPPEASSTNHPPTRLAAPERRGKSEPVEESTESSTVTDPELLREPKSVEESEALRAQAGAATTENEKASEAEPEEDPELARFLDQPNHKLSFRVDAETKEVVVSVIDRETDDVVRQIPPEELLRLAERLKSSRGSLVRSKA